MIAKAERYSIIGPYTTIDKDGIAYNFDEGTACRVSGKGLYARAHRGYGSGPYSINVPHDALLAIQELEILAFIHVDSRLEAVVASTDGQIYALDTDYLRIIMGKS